jgi:hypothetical protein
MCSPPVTHGNIKATIILLDAQLMPYLSHCGLGKFSHFVSATRMVSVPRIVLLLYDYFVRKNGDAVNIYFINSRTLELSGIRI